ncbi:MAG: RNA polymerase sigma-54 factor, partial [Brevundimonas sp.]|nr:RNA polymerase sigma-54 factor [Brevundimonas sp.]
MALGPRLDLRQSQSLVMTPQLQQAIKLLALSNLEIEAFIGEALESNPLLEIGEAAPGEAAPPQPEDIRRTTLESSPVDQLVSEGRAADDRPLDIDTAALDRDRDTGDGEWGSSLRVGPMGEAGPDIDEHGEG